MIVIAFFCREFVLFLVEYKIVSLLIQVCLRNDKTIHLRGLKNWLSRLLLLQQLAFLLRYILWENRRGMLYVCMFICMCLCTVHWDINKGETEVTIIEFFHWFLSGQQEAFKEGDLPILVSSTLHDA